MPPPRKQGADGKVEIHHALVPLTAPFAFATPSAFCCAAGSSLAIVDILTEKRSYIHTAAYGITKICANAAKGLVAFCEAGICPQVYVHSVEDQSLLFTLADVTELELGDMSFSRCGSRLYLLSRASSKRLRVYSTTTGAQLPGADLQLPARFDKLSVYPGHKDQLALVRSSNVRIVTLQKSFETYITKLHPATFPADIDLAVSAFTWAPSGHFLVATRQGTLCTVDGHTGAMLHACHVEQPITTLAVSAEHILTVHIGNELKVWSHDPRRVPSEGVVRQLASTPPIDASPNTVGGGVYLLRRTIELDTLQQYVRPEHRMVGQVAHLQVAPNFTDALLTTAEGEAWTIQVPTAEEGARRAGSDEEEEGEDGADDLAIRLLAWCHMHPVADVVPLGPQSRVCASCDDGGRLRIWELARSSDPKGFRTIRFSSALTSLAADDEGTVLLVGSESGCVHVVTCSNWKTAQVCDTQRISDTGIARLCAVTHTGRCMSCAAVLFNNKIACFTVMLRDPKVRMLGFLDVMGSVEDICFHTRDFKSESVTSPKLLVAGSFRTPSIPEQLPAVWLVRFPPLDHDPSHLELRKDLCPIFSMRLNAEGKPDEKLISVSSATKKSVAVGLAGGGIVIYPIPSVAGLPTSRMPVASPEAALQSHEQLVSALTLSQDGNQLISASMDGCIRVGYIDIGRPAEMQKILHNPFTGGVAQVRVTRDGRAIISTGGTDGILCWGRPGQQLHIEPKEFPDDEFGDQVPLWDIDDRDTAAYPQWQPTSAEEKAMAAQTEADDPELNAVALAQRKALVLEVEGLRKKLRALVDLNAACPELEQLERNEFCVDFEERDAIAAKTRERCNALRAQIERENLARQLIRHRLIKEFWDPMRTKGCQISSLMSQVSVSNYPAREVSEDEKATVRKLQCMRKVERLEMEMVQGRNKPAELRHDIILTSEPFTTGREQYMVNWWAAGAENAAGGDDDAAKKDGDKGEGDDGGGDKAEAEDSKQDAQNTAAAAESNDKQYLYEPFELLTNCRRRLQISLLQSLAAEYRANFNELFKGCQEEKQRVMSEIKEKIARMRAILAELQIDEHVAEPELHELEETGAVLKVRDSEIKAEKWISEEERKRLAEAAAKEEERQRQLRENDAGTRALMQMMGGTLKTKKDLSALERTIEKEPWMDLVPEEEMTEVQQVAMKEFREKEKALLEEQDKYRKQLDAELKKCRVDVEDLSQQFEQTLKKLHHQRFEHDAKFFCQELYCVRLQLALLQNAEDNHVLQQSSKDLNDTMGRLIGCEKAWNSFREKVNSAKEKQDKRVHHEREVSHSQYFKQQMAPFGLEPDLVTKTLWPMFRRKRETNQGTDQRRASSQNSDKARQASGSETASPVGIDDADPFTKAADAYPDIGTVREAGIEEIVEEAENAFQENCPEGVDDASFSKMLELRHERLLAEVEVQKGSAVLQEMGGLLSHHLRERDGLKGEYDQIQLELNDHRALMERELYDIELFFRLKQGQVEVQQAAVVTDYSDAIVIDKEVVESRNRCILELGKTKIGGLEKNKEDRKKLNAIQWELRMLALQTLDLEERTKDVHMLRVTKDLQSLLKGGEEGRNKADADLLERKIEHLSNTTQQKEQALRKQYAMGSHAAKLRKMENDMLGKKLRELQQNVIQREHIRRLRAPQGGGNAGGGGKEGDRPRIIGGGGKIEENEAAVRAAQAGFKEVRTRQSLMDTAKKHAEELELLRKELDRLRQKTFPSFVQMQREPSNPDFR